MTVAASILLATDFVTALSKQSTLVLLASRDQSVSSKASGTIRTCIALLSRVLYQLSYASQRSPASKAFRSQLKSPVSHRLSLQMPETLAKSRLAGVTVSLASYWLLFSHGTPRFDAHCRCWYYFSPAAINCCCIRSSSSDSRGCVDSMNSSSQRSFVHAA